MIAGSTAHAHVFEHTSRRALLYYKRMKKQLNEPRNRDDAAKKELIQVE